MSQQAAASGGRAYSLDTSFSPKSALSSINTTNTNHTNIRISGDERFVGIRSLFTVHDPPARIILSREFNDNMIAGNETDMIDAHLPRKVRETTSAVLKTDTKRRPTKGLED